MLDREKRGLYFLLTYRMKGMDLMLHFYTGRFFYFYCFFSKGLPGAR
jgi:hypothetical protein